MSDNSRSPVLRPAPPDEAIHPLIAGRWSSRAVEPTNKVDAAVIRRMVEAARWAPSAANNQPWRFLVFDGSDPEALRTARAALTPGNVWALGAPLLLFILARIDRPGSGKPNTRGLYETGMAAALMALQAAEEGLVFHQMAGFDARAVRNAFSVPENYEIIVAAVAGPPGLIDAVPEDKRPLETAPRVRKSQEEILYLNGAVPESEI